MKRMLKLGALFVLVCAVCGSYVSAEDVSGSSGDANSTTILEPNKPAAAAGIKWIEVGDDDEGGYITVSHDSFPNVLRFHYFKRSAKSPSLACNVGDFTAADIDLTVKFACYSIMYGQYFGVAYRMPSQTFFPWDNTAGKAYYVRINAQDAPNIRLYYGDTVIGSANADILATTLYTIRIVASGSSHKVYFEGNQVIDVTHSDNTAAGYVGLWDFYSITYFDDFSVIDTASKKTLSDDFNRPYSTDVSSR